MTDITIEVKPFSWNDNFLEIALEDFDMIRSSLSYCAAQSIGAALAKLQLMEEKDLNPNTITTIINRLDQELKLADEEKERCARENQLQFDSAKGYATGIYKAIEIIKEELR